MLTISLQLFYVYQYFSAKSNEKSVRFNGKKGKLQKKTVSQPILKKSFIKPLQVNIVCITII